MPTAPIISGNTGRLGTPGRLGPIYQYGSALPYGPYTGLPGAGGNRTGTSSSSASSGPTAAAQTFLNGVLSGNTLPYSPDRVTQMKSQASDTNAAGEAALNRQLDNQAAAGGASWNDPSRTGAKMNTMARRQTANQTSNRDIQETATGANFDAQLRAASMLEESRRQSEALQAGVQRTALGYMPWSQGGGGGTPSPSQFVTGYTSNASSNYTDATGNGEAQPWQQSRSQPESLTERNRRLRMEAYRDRIAREQWEGASGSYPVASDGYYEMQ